MQPICTGVLKAAEPTMAQSGMAGATAGMLGGEGFTAIVQRLLERASRLDATAALKAGRAPQTAVMQRLIPVLMGGLRRRAVRTGGLLGGLAGLNYHAYQSGQHPLFKQSADPVFVPRPVDQLHNPAAGWADQAAFEAARPRTWGETGQRIVDVLSTPGRAIGDWVGEHYQDFKNPGQGSGQPGTAKAIKQQWTPGKPGELVMAPPQYAAAVAAREAARLPHHPAAAAATQLVAGEPTLAHPTKPTPDPISAEANSGATQSKPGESALAGMGPNAEAMARYGGKLLGPAALTAAVGLPTLLIYMAERRRAKREAEQEGRPAAMPMLAGYGGGYGGGMGGGLPAITVNNGYLPYPTGPVKTGMLRELPKHSSASLAPLPIAGLLAARPVAPSSTPAAPTPKTAAPPKTPGPPPTPPKPKLAA